MRLGILSDIHEAVVPLRNALERFDREGIDRLVILGDLFEVGKRLEETVSLLKPYSPVGVWGNHDWGLCGEVIPKIRDRFSDGVFDFMRGLRPSLEVEGHLFQHIEPWLDATNLEHLWGWFEPFDIADRYDRSFAAVPHRRMFIGHHHRWFAATPERVLDWKGEGPLDLKVHPRILVVVHALMMGHAAILDTESEILFPLAIPSAEDFAYESS